MTLRRSNSQGLEQTASFESGAEFSDCRRYRYALWRRWDWQGYAKQIMFIGLNPSTANESENDATIRRCIQFAKEWGYCGVLVTNVYAWCSTDPRRLKNVSNPTGPDNDKVLSDRQSQAGLIVAAWGNHCPPEREQEVCRAIARTIYCLGCTKDGRPRHPLYLPKTTQLEIFWSP